MHIVLEEIPRGGSSCGVTREEDWDAECQSQPEADFKLTTTTTATSQPKDSFLRYLKTVHGRSTAHRIREELNSRQITNANFNQWKEESFKKMMDKFRH